MDQPYIKKNSQINKNSHQTKTTLIVPLRMTRDMVESAWVNMGHFLHHLVVGWLFGFYDISSFLGYLTLNPFLWK